MKVKRFDINKFNIGTSLSVLIEPVSDAENLLIDMALYHQ